MVCYFPAEWKVVSEELDLSLGLQMKLQIIISARAQPSAAFIPISIYVFCTLNLHPIAENYAAMHGLKYSKFIRSIFIQINSIPTFDSDSTWQKQTKKWTAVATLTIPKRYFGPVVHAELLYVLGRRAIKRRWMRKCKFVWILLVFGWKKGKLWRQCDTKEMDIQRVLPMFPTARIQNDRTIQLRWNRKLFFTAIYI